MNPNRCSPVVAILLFSHSLIAQTQRVVAISSSPAVRITPAHARRWNFTVTSPLTSCHVTGRVLGIAGGQKDVNVLVMTRDDYSNRQNSHEAEVIFESGQKTAVTLDVPIEGEGEYVFVVSNSFSALSSKTAQLQHVKLTCSEPVVTAAFDTGTVADNVASSGLPDFPIEVAAAPALDIGANQWRSWTWEQTSPRTMCSISGRVLGLAGGQKDVEVLVMTEDDYLNWANGHEAKAEFQSGQKTAVTLDWPVLGAGKHVLVVSNRFSPYSAKTVQMQRVGVTCGEWPRS